VPDDAAILRQAETCATVSCAKNGIDLRTVYIGFRPNQ
jgi:hypothetical protein